MADGNPDLHGRLIAAERNALTAITSQRELREECGTLKVEVAKARQEVAEMQRQLISLKGLVAASMGAGPTAR